MRYIDLRPLDPPLGYNADQVPLVEIDPDFDYEAHRFSYEGRSTRVFDIPFAPVVLRQLTPLAHKDATHLEEVVEKGNAHFNNLQRLGTYIPSHRHIALSHPSKSYSEVSDQGELLTLVEKLADHEPLQVEKHPDISLRLVDTLTTYTEDLLNGPPDTTNILWDIYNPRQYSVHTSTGRVALHDIDLSFVTIIGINPFTQEEEHHMSFRHGMYDLSALAARVVQTTEQSDSAAQARQVYDRVVKLPCTREMNNL